MVIKRHKQSWRPIVPENWHILYLNELTDLITKGTTPTTYGYEYIDEGVHFIKVESITDHGKFIKDRISFISQEAHEKLSRSQIKAGDLLITIAGHLGRVALVDESICPANTNQAVAIARLKMNKQYDKRFLYYYLISDNVKKYIQMVSTTGAQPNLSLKQVGDILVACPSYVEQQKIASILSSVDQAIEKTESIIEKMDKMKKGLTQWLLTKGMGHTEFKESELGLIPIDWDVVKLEEVSEKITKGTTPTTYGFEFVNKGVNFIKVECIDNNGELIVSRFSKITEEAHQKLSRSQIEDGDLLITIAGALGRITVATEEILPANTNQAIGIVRAKEKGELVQFLFYALRGYAIERYIKIVSTVGAQPNLSLKQIGELKIALPPKNEFIRITKILKSVDKKIKTEKQRLGKHHLVKKGLIKDLLTGKVNVKISDR